MVTQTKQPFLDAQNKRHRHYSPRLLPHRLFGKMEGEKYVVYEFTTGKFITQLLLIASLCIHIFVNVRPLLVSLGVIKLRERRIDCSLILSVFVLFFTFAVICYYLGLRLV